MIFRKCHIFLNTYALKKRYEIDCKWRLAWTTISRNHEHGRLQTKQDRIERRIMIVENRIALLMKEFDRINCEI